MGVAVGVGWGERLQHRGMELVIALIPALFLLVRGFV